MGTKIEIERSDEDKESNRERERRWNQKVSKNDFAHPKHRLPQNKTQFSSKNWN